MTGKIVQNRKRIDLQDGVPKNDKRIVPGKNVEQSRGKVEENVKKQTLLESKVEREENIVKQLIFEILAEAATSNWFYIREPAAGNPPTYKFKLIHGRGAYEMKYIFNRGDFTPDTTNTDPRADVYTTNSLDAADEVEKKLKLATWKHNKGSGGFKPYKKYSNHSKGWASNAPQYKDKDGNDGQVQAKVEYPGSEGETVATSGTVVTNAGKVYHTSDPTKEIKPQKAKSIDKAVLSSIWSTSTSGLGEYSVEASTYEGNINKFGGEWLDPNGNNLDANYSKRAVTDKEGDLLYYVYTPKGSSLGLAKKLIVWND